MKKFIVALVVLAMLVTPFTVFGATGVTYTSGFKLQNLSATTANIVIDFYKQDGTVQASVPDTIPANGDKTYFPLSAVPAGFDGSAVVSSDQQVAAVTNVVGNNFQRNDAYLAFTAGATSANIPLVFKAAGGYDTWFNVQNTGGSDATVNVTYTGVSGGGCSETAVVIKAGAAHRFDQAASTSCLAGISGAFTGSAKVTSTQPVAAVVVEVGPQNLLAYPALAATSTAPVFPLIQANNSNYWTGIQIMNTGASSTDVTVAFTPAGAGTACSQGPVAIGAGKSATFGYPMPAACGVKFIGSAKVSANTATMPLAGVVNQIMAKPSPYTVYGANGSSYAGFDAAAATSKVSMPIIMDRNSGWTTGFAIVNMGTQATTIDCAFTGNARTIHAANVAPGAALNDYQLGTLAAGYVGAATCTATGGDQKIAGVVNELATGNSSTDVLSTYPAFNY